MAPLSTMTFVRGQEGATVTVIAEGIERPGYPTPVGSIEVEIIDGNIVITARRIDEAWFGPVSLVVV